MIHQIERQRTLRDAAARMARTIRMKARNGHYRNRLHVVAANEDGSFSLALDGTSGWNHIMANPSRVVGTYFTTSCEKELAARLLEDIGEVAG